MTGNLSLFKNDKGGVETRPDYRGMGRCTMDDGSTAEMKLAGWIKTDKRGEKYISLKLEPETRPQQPALNVPPAAQPQGATPRPTRPAAPPAASLPAAGRAAPASADEAADLAWEDRQGGEEIPF